MTKILVGHKINIEEIYKDISPSFSNDIDFGNISMSAMCITEDDFIRVIKKYLNVIDKKNKLFIEE